MMQHRVRVSPDGRVSAAVTAHIGRGGSITRRSKGGELAPPGAPRLRKAMTQQHQRAAPLRRYAHPQGTRLECVKMRFAQGCLHGAHAIADINAGSLAAAIPALAPLSCKRASLAESSGFKPRMTAVILFNRQCDSQICNPGFARQRAVLARVTAHMRSQSVGRSGLGTGVHRAFFSAKTVSWLST